MVKKIKEEIVETPEKVKTTDDEKQKQYSIVLKEKDKDGNYLCMDVDNIMPTFIFGEGSGWLMGIVGDRAFFIPPQTINWFEQNYGVEKDRSIVMALYEKKMKEKKKDYIDSSII